MTFRTFVLLAIVILQCFAQQEISWSDKMPQCIDNPFANINCDEQKEVIRAVEKPTYIKIKEECDAFPKLAVYMNGINSDCLRKETTFMSPTRIAIHNFAQNEAWFVDPATAHPYGFYPPRGLFIFGYSPEPHTVLTGFGGTEYHVDFQLPIPFHPFNPVWKLNFTDSFQRATYYPIETFGDIPSPRTEMSIVEIGDGDLFLFGGVALGSTGFDSFGDGYHFDYQTSTFTKLFDANDTNPTQPQSRYHAHLWFTVIDGVRWVILSQGVTRTSSGTFELNDEKAYNLDTNQWFNLTSVPALWQVTPNNSTIRHGINYDFMTHDDEHVICTSLGDLEHTSNISTKGCQFEIVSVDATMCSYVTANSSGVPQLSWFRVTTELDEDEQNRSNGKGVIRSKYPGGFYDEKRRRLVAAGGDFNLPYEPFVELQVYNRGIRLGNLSGF